MALPKLTIGLDLGDRYTELCALDARGQIRATERLRTTPAALERYIAAVPRCRIVLEVGTHSPWVSRLLQRLGHEVLVANARQLRLIYGSDRKSDRVDAETLARLGRLDPALLKPIHHRGPEAQADLAQLRARDALVRTRTLLINHVRGAVKAWGARLPASSAPAFATTATAGVPLELRSALGPLLELIATLTHEIRRMERQLERLAQEQYPETARLRQPSGVGLLTALCYVLTLEDPGRFHQSRAVGPYLGLCPRRDQSGGRDAQLRITKRGDAMLRRLLVSGVSSVT
jgi:transposase